MDIGGITCSYYLLTYDYEPPTPFDWGEMCVRYRATFGREALLQLARRMRGIGLTAIELWEPMCSYRVYSVEDARALRAELEAMGFRSIAYCIGGWGAGDVDEVEPAYAFAAALGAEVVVGCIDERQQATILPAIEAAGARHGLVYAIENHPAPNFSDPAAIAAATRDYAHIGANLDTGIYYMMGHDLLEALETLGDKVYHVHLKDTRRGEEGCFPLGDGEAPNAALLSALRARGYGRMVSIEYEAPSDPTPGLHQSLGYILGALA